MTQSSRAARKAEAEAQAEQFWADYMRDWRTKGNTFAGLADQRVQAHLFCACTDMHFELGNRAAEMMQNLRRDVGGVRTISSWFDRESQTAGHSWSCPRRGYKQCSVLFCFMEHTDYVRFAVTLRGGSIYTVTPDRISRTATGSANTSDEEEERPAPRTPQQPPRARTRSPPPQPKARPTRTRQPVQREEAASDPTPPWRR